MSPLAALPLTALLLIACTDPVATDTDAADTALPDTADTSDTAPYSLQLAGELPLTGAMDV